MKIYCDGSWCPELPGKPGIVAASVVAGDHEVKTWSQTIKAVDSNSSELIAIIHALQWALNNDQRKVTIFTDSRVAFRCVNSVLVTRKYHKLVCRIKDLLSDLDVTINWIPRCKNRRADSLCRFEKEKVLRHLHAA